MTKDGFVSEERGMIKKDFYWKEEAGTVRLYYKYGYKNLCLGIIHRGMR